VILLAAAMLLAAAPTALAADPAAQAGRAQAAESLRVAPAGVSHLRTDPELVSVGDRSFRTMLFAARDGAQAWVAVDVATGEAIDTTAFARLLEADLGRPDRDKFAKEARQALDRAGAGGRATLGFLLAPVDYASAVAAVKARHPRATWSADRPTGPDEATVEAARMDLLREKAALVVRARAPFEVAARKHGHGEPIGLDLAPIVFAAVDGPGAAALAARRDVIGVRSTAPFSQSMSSAGRTIQAEYPRYYGWNGSGINVGIIEYGGVGISSDLPLSARLAAKRVTTTSSGRMVCANGPVAASGHMTLVAGISVSRGATGSPGVARSARFIESSANSSITAASSDPRILKAVECAILAGAHVVNLSLVQNSQSGYGTTSDAYLDHVVAAHHVFVAIAAGNHDGAQTGRDQCLAGGVVPSPGSSWNALTVGGTNDGQNTSTNTATLWANDRLWWHTSRNEPGYCWREPPALAGDSINDRVKPEIVAPAVSVAAAGRVGTGSSFATPQVAGAAATIIARDAALRQSPETVKAVLLAGSVVHQTVAPGASAPNVGLQGLGTMSTKWSHAAVSRDAPTGSPDTGSYGLSVVTGTRVGECYTPSRVVETKVEAHAGRRIRFVIAWDSRQDSNLTPGRRWADFNLTLLRDGQVVATSNRVASNVEWVDITAPTAGTYTARFQAVRWGCDVAAEAVGWSWVSYGVP
jgi:hypothetical protein